MTDDELKEAFAKLFSDPVVMAEMHKRMQDMLEEEMEREQAYQLEQRRAWDNHKHETYS